MCPSAAILSVATFAIFLTIISKAKVLQLSIAGRDYLNFQIYANESNFKNETIWNEYMTDFCLKLLYGHYACEQIKLHADSKINADDFSQMSYSPSGLPEYAMKDSYFSVKALDDEKKILQVPVSVFYYS